MDIFIATVPQVTTGEEKEKEKEKNRYSSLLPVQNPRSSLSPFSFLSHDATVPRISPTAAVYVEPLLVDNQSM